MPETMEERIIALALEQGQAGAGASIARRREQVTMESQLRTDLGLDSLRMVAFLFRCGEELGVDPNDLLEAIAAEGIRTVGDVVTLAKRLAGGGDEAGHGRGLP